MTDKYTDDADWMPDDDVIVPYTQLSEEGQIMAHYDLRESLDYPSRREDPLL